MLPSGGALFDQTFTFLGAAPARRAGAAPRSEKSFLIGPPGADAPEAARAGRARLGDRRPGAGDLVADDPVDLGDHRATVVGLDARSAVGRGGGGGAVLFHDLGAVADEEQAIVLAAAHGRRVLQVRHAARAVVGEQPAVGHVGRAAVRRGDDAEAAAAAAGAAPSALAGGAVGDGCC